MRKKPGLPSGFNVGTTREDIEAPAAVGGFLEETLGGLSPAPTITGAEGAQELEPEPDVTARRREAPRAKPPRRKPAEVVELRPAADGTAESNRRDAVGEGASSLSDAEEQEAPRASPRRPSPLRKQINLKPDAVALADRLLAKIQRDSGQKDAKSSEMFTALLLALEEASSHLDLSGVPRRGAWGSRTARAFPVALKKQFVQAIGKLYEETDQG